MHLSERGPRIGRHLTKHLPLNLALFQHECIQLFGVLELVALVVQIDLVKSGQMAGVRVKAQVVVDVLDSLSNKFELSVVAPFPHARHIFGSLATPQHVRDGMQFLDDVHASPVNGIHLVGLFFPATKLDNQRHETGGGADEQDEHVESKLRCRCKRLGHVSAKHAPKIFSQQRLHGRGECNDGRGRKLQDLRLVEPAGISSELEPKDV